MGSRHCAPKAACGFACRTCQLHRSPYLTLPRTSLTTLTTGHSTSHEQTPNGRHWRRTTWAASMPKNSRPGNDVESAGRRRSHRRPAAIGSPPQCHCRGAGRLRRPARSARRRRDRRAHQPAPPHRPGISRSRRASAGREAALHDAAGGRRSGFGRAAAEASFFRSDTSSASIRRFTPPPSNIRNPKYIEAVRASGFTFRSTDVGVVLDLMIHDIDLVLSLVGSPVRRSTRWAPRSSAATRTWPMPGWSLNAAAWRRFRRRA